MLCIAQVESIFALNLCNEQNPKTNKFLINLYVLENGPRREKTCLQGFQQSECQTSLFSYRD